MTPEIKLPSLEKPGDALRQTLLAFAQAITDDIANLPDDTTTRIHDIRVSTKKIRALVLLAGKRVPKADAKSLFDLLRAIRTVFAGTRDAEVMRAGLAHLLPKRRVATAIRQLQLEPHDSPVDAASATSLAANLSTRLDALDFAALKPRHVADAAGRSYRTARQLRKKCRHLDDDILMHTWRKRVKEFCYHAMALADLKRMAKLVPSADELAETLGAYHDLALLTAQAKDAPAILAVVLEAKQKTGARCLELAADVFTAAPEKFAQKLAAQI